MTPDLDAIDLRISTFMRRWGVTALRYSLASSSSGSAS